MLLCFIKYRVMNSYLYAYALKSNQKKFLLCANKIIDHYFWQIIINIINNVFESYKLLQFDYHINIKKLFCEKLS